MKFIDEVEIQVASGAGGAGHVSFRREKYVPRGGPDGGDGGTGGAVIFTADVHRNTLIDYRRRRHWRADDGVPGGKKQMYGAAGSDCLCVVPIGTLIFDQDTGELLADLDHQGARFEIPGGKGGLGNMHFRSSTNRTPRQSLPPEPGQERTIRLELRLLADVGLLGFPNAGKSTFLSRVSAARPKVADYPFTTLTPQLGVVGVGDEQGFVLADIPGLVEGASEGAGLGLQFLRHLERCGCYIHLISPEDEGTDPVERYRVLRHELEAYGADLIDRPELLVLNKIDLLDASERERLKRELEIASGARVWLASGVSGEGVKRIIDAAWRVLEDQREAGIQFRPSAEMSESDMAFRDGFDDDVTDPPPGEAFGEDDAFTEE